MDTFEHCKNRDLHLLKKIKDTPEDVCISIEIHGILDRKQKSLVTRTFHALKDQLYAVDKNLSIRTDRDMPVCGTRFIMAAMPADTYKKLLAVSPGTCEKILNAFADANKALQDIPGKKFFRFSDDIKRLAQKEYTKEAVTQSLDTYQSFITNAFVKKLQDECITSNRTIAQDVKNYLKKCAKEGIRFEARQDEMTDLAVVISADDWIEEISKEEAWQKTTK